MPQLRAPDGSIVNVPDEQASQLIAGGYQPIGATETSQTRGAVEHGDSGVLAPAGALASSFLGGATLGLSDYAFRGLLDKGDFERLAADREAHPIVSGIGQLGGMVAGGPTPAGAVSRATASLAETGGVVAKIGAAGLEGAVQNAGAYLSDTALGDRELSAEGLRASLGAGFEFGAGGGAVALGIERGTIAARRMFSRIADGTDRAANEAQQAWQAKYQATIEANDAAADVARAKLAQAQLARQQAQVARDHAAATLAETRAGTAPGATAPEAVAAGAGQEAAGGAGSPVPGAAPTTAAAAPPLHPDVEIAGLLRDRAMAAAQPEQLAAWDAEHGSRLQSMMAARQVAGGIPPQLADLAAKLPETAASREAALSAAAEAEITAALREHDAAKADLDDLLQRLEVPEVGQPGGAIGQHAVPVGEFGAPGERGIKLGEELAPRPPTAVEAITGDVTAVGRRKPVVEATPVEQRAAVTEGRIPPEPLSDAEYGQYKQAYANAASKDQYAAELHYSKGGDEIVNPELRSGKPLSDAATKLRDNLDSAFALSESRIPRDATLYRGISDNPIMGSTGVKARFSDVKPGDILPADPAFTSSTYSEASKSRNEDIVFAIHAPAGTPALPIRSQFSGEQEMLLPRGMQFRVDRIEHVPITDRWRNVGKHELLPDGSVRLIGKDGSSKVVPPIKELHVSIVNKFDLPATNARPVAVGLDAPIEKLSLRQVGEYQNAIDEALKTATPAEKDALYKKWDAAVERRNAIEDGKLKEPEHEYGAKPTGGHDPAPAAGNDLLAALSGMKSGIDKGENLVEMGAPARDAYRAAKAERTSAAAEHFRSEALARREARAQAVAQGETPNPFHEPVTSIGIKPAGDPDAFFRDLTAPKSRDAYVAANIGRAMRESGGDHAAALARVEREWADRGGSVTAAAAAPTQTWREFQAERMGAYMQSEGGHAGAMKRLGREWGEIKSARDGSIKRLEQAHDAAVERAAAATDPAERAAAVQDARAIGEQLTAVGQRPGAVEDVAAAAPAVTRYERASAKLTEALGDAAPPAAQDAAKAFRAAEDAADRKTVERTTRAIDDHVASGGVPGPSAADPQWFAPSKRGQQVSAAKADKLKADAAYARARATETEARVGAAAAKRTATETRTAAEAARPAPPEPAPPSRLGALVTTVAAAGELGVPGIPHPRDIPVIGPLLSLWTKFRIAKAMVGRFSGRVPATADARAAALVAKAKDKIATAVDRTLGLVQEVAAKRQPIAATAVVLGHRLIDDGEPDAPKGASAQQLAAVRIREISAAATRPELVTAMVRKKLGAVADPDLIASAEKLLMQQFQYLASVAPKMPPPNPYSKTEWVPSPGAAADLAQRIDVLHDPTAAFRDPTPAKADALANFYGKLFAFAQQRLAERAADMTEPMPYRQQLQATLIFRVPVATALEPGRLVILQSAHAALRESMAQAGGGGGGGAAPPAPSVAQPTNINAMYQTSADRRAARSN